MTYNEYLPEDERYSDSKLKGVYKVSFEIQVGSENDLSVSDIAQALTEGFGDKLVDKVAELSVEKITKKAVKVLKVGDTVRIKQNIKISSNIYSDDSYYFVGAPSEISELMGKDVDIEIQAGAIGLVNKIAEGKVEVADLDQPITKFAEIGLDSINVDLITVNAEVVEKIDLEEVK